MEQQKENHPIYMQPNTLKCSGRKELQGIHQPATSHQSAHTLSANGAHSVKSNPIVKLYANIFSFCSSPMRVVEPNFLKYQKANEMKYSGCKCW